MSSVNTTNQINSSISETNELISESVSETNELINEVESINEVELSNLVLKNNLILYMKWVMLELSCNNRIDHRNYDRDRKSETKLKQIIEANDYDFNLGFDLMADQLISHKNNKLNKLIKLLISAYKSEDEDYIYEIQQMLSRYVNNYIGFYEIGSIHPDEADKFEAKLLIFLGIYNSNGKLNKDMISNNNEEEFEDLEELEELDNELYELDDE